MSEAKPRRIHRSKRAWIRGEDARLRCLARRRAQERRDTLKRRIGIAALGLPLLIGGLISLLSLWLRVGGGR